MKSSQNSGSSASQSFHPHLQDSSLVTGLPIAENSIDAKLHQPSDQRRYCEFTNIGICAMAMLIRLIKNL